MNTPKIISTLLKKYRFLIGVLLLTTLAACGGGGGSSSGGGNPPSITAAQCNAQNLILQNGQCVSECSDALPRIESNECMVGTTLNEAQLTEKQSICIASDMVFNGKYAEDICITCTGDTPIRNINTCEPSQAVCNSQDMILKNGACLSCTGDTPTRKNNICEPSQAFCDSQDMILKNGACSTCTGNTPTRNGNVCEPSQAICNNQNMILESGACSSCTGNTPTRNGNVCEPSQAVCNNQNMILESGACSSCTGNTPTRNGNVCEPSQAVCNNQNMILESGACSSCTGNTPTRNGNVCEPSQAVCNNQNMILESGACSSCTGNTPTRNGNVCEPSQAVCNNQNMILESGACSSCTGNTPTRNGNVCEPSQAVCNNQNMILESGACSSCTGNTPTRNGNVCEPSQAVCNNQNMILESGACSSCTGNTPTRNGNVCEPSQAICNNQNMILEGNACRLCTGDTVRNGNICTARVSPETCTATNEILKDNRCQACPDGSESNSDNSICINETLAAPNPSNNVDYLTTNGHEEYVANGYGKQAIGAHYAYQRGYWGQGVTVAVIDGELDVNHPDLAPNLAGVYHATTKEFTVTLASVHGTAVAGVIAAARNGVGLHGVAPSARIFGIVGLPANGQAQNFPEAWRFASTVAPIVNNSYGVISRGVVKSKDNDEKYYVELPVFGGYIQNGKSLYEQFRDRNHLTTHFADKDIVMVWAAGNERWHVGGSIRICPIANLKTDEDDPPSCTVGRTTVPIQDFIDNYIPEEFMTVNFTTQFYDTADYKATDSSYFMYAPNVDTQLRDRWLGVVATDLDNLIASFSNGCGDSKYWCVAAPGRFNNVILRTIYNTKNFYLSGTSIAAPFASGALALLKSRFPNMPMKVIRAILLTTATDLTHIPNGERGTGDYDPDLVGIDDIYGWGLVNIERAITLQGGLLLPFGGSGAPPDSSGVSGVNGVRLADAHINLPEQFSHIQSDLSSISIAVSVVGNAYYNADLSQLVRLEQKIQPRTFGNAANEILNTTAQRQVRSGAWFAATDANGKIRQAGAQTNFSNLGLDFAGTWQLRHDFCDDCQDSVWHEWRQWNKSADANQNHLSKNATNVTDDLADMTDGMQSPFFARRSGAIIIAQQGEGLRPFIAHSGKLDGNENATYKQIGLRWQQHFTAANKMRFDIAASASRIDEKNSLWGADFGALVIGGRDAINMRTRQGRLLIRGAFGKNWRGFASIEEARGDNYHAESGGLLNGVSNLRARGWSGGVETHSIFSGGDILRLSARRETRIIGGSATIKHRQAEGDFSGAFYGSIKDAPEELKDEQQLIDTTSIINLGSKARDIYAIGYILKPTNNGGYDSRLAIGIEHDTSGKTAASAQWHIDF